MLPQTGEERTAERVDAAAADPEKRQKARTTESACELLSSKTLRTALRTGEERAL